MHILVLHFSFKNACMNDRWFIATYSRVRSFKKEYKNFGQIKRKLCVATVSNLMLSGLQFSQNETVILVHS